MGLQKKIDKHIHVIYSLISTSKDYVYAISVQSTWYMKRLS